MGITITAAESRTLWGTSIDVEGTVRFRLWAPAQQEVTLVLVDGDIPMEPVGDGWFEVRTRRARPGDIYLFRLADGREIADPASRAQAGEVDGPSVVVDHDTYRWLRPDWKGRPWEEAVIYELHVGTFTPEGTFAAAREHLARLRDLGFTAIEIMPVAHFAGERGWGYDGVLLHAPYRRYGTPEDLKALVDAAHQHGLMVLLDVVYNHFGPVGNYLHLLAPPFFHPEQSTPWGAAIAFEEEAVRRYFIESALQWVRDYRFDGLRLDAVDQIEDPGPRHILLDMAAELHACAPGRPVHLSVEDHHSRRGLLRRADDGTVRLYTAGWNDEFHHALHVIATGEATGHYKRFGKDSLAILAEAVAKGFLWADSEHDTLGPREGPLPPDVHVNFLQNHDHIGNRAFGERLTTLTDPRLLEVMTVLLMLAPGVPLVFMGEEYGERRPFHFFADYHEDVAHAMRLGRALEAESFGGLPPGTTAEDLPDPLAEETFRASLLDWPLAESEEGQAHMERLKALIRLRREAVVPLFCDAITVAGDIREAEDGVLAVDWRFPAATLQIRANLGTEERNAPPVSGRIVHAVPAAAGDTPGRLAGPSIVVALDETA